MTSLKVVTWNTNGIRDTAKHKGKKDKIVQSLKELEASVAFLQETHIGKKDINHIKIIDGWRSYFTVWSPRSKGVAILIKNELMFEKVEEILDPAGCYIVLICKLNSKCFTLVNVYNHRDKYNVLCNLSKILFEKSKGVLIVAGDFNTILSKYLDRENFTTYEEPLRDHLKVFISSLMLVDVWGLKNPAEREFTRSPYKGVNTKGKKKKILSAARLDMFFMPRNALWLVESCTIVECQTGTATGTVAQTEATTHEHHSDISDHRPVVLCLLLHQSESVTNTAAGTFQNEIKLREVLKAISSLIECENTTGETMEQIRMNQEETAVVLQKHFNNLINNEITPDFTRSVERQGWHFFEAQYMILATILVWRLEALLLPSNQSNNTKASYQHVQVFGFDTPPKTIKKVFLTEALSFFSFTLKELLVKNLLTNTDSDVQLKEGCPLTPTLLTVALEYFAKTSLKLTEVEVCHYRNHLIIYTNSDQSTLPEVIERFEKNSGITFTVKKTTEMTEQQATATDSKSSTSNGSTGTTSTQQDQPTTSETITATEMLTATTAKTQQQH